MTIAQQKLLQLWADMNGLATWRDQYGAIHFGHERSGSFANVSSVNGCMFRIRTKGATMIAADFSDCVSALRASTPRASAPRVLSVV